LLIQIDGLSSARLLRAISAGLVPNLAALTGGGARVVGRTSAAPPSTPVFQGALLYGAQRVVHGYTWFDRAAGRVRRMDVPDDIALVEDQLERASPRHPLFRVAGAAAYFTSFVGGAARVAFTVASGLFPQRGFRARQVARGLLRAARRLPAEAAAALADFARHARDAEVDQELGYLAMRVVGATFFEEVGTRHAVADLEEGRPLVYIDFFGYDDVAHRRGPDHPEAFAQLPRIDARIGELLSAARERGVDVMVVSDHGQSAATPYHVICGRSLAAEVHRACAPEGAEVEALADELERGRVDAARVLKWGRPLGALPAWRGRLRARLAARRLAALGAPAAELAVVSGGSIAHVYVGRAPGGASLEEIERRFPRLLPALRGSPGVGLIVARRTARGPLVLWRGETAGLLDEAALRALPPFRDVGPALLAGILRRVIASATAGDLVLYGAFARAGAVTFDPEWGSHGGVHPEELDLFVVPPDGMDLPPTKSLDPADLHVMLRSRFTGSDAVRSL
jgi:hypothetical protein